MVGSTKGPEGDAVLAALERLEARLARIERAVDEVRGLETPARGAIAAVVDVVDSHAAALRAEGVDIDARLAALSAAALDLSRPEVLAGLRAAADLALHAPGALAAVVDVVDAHAASAAEGGVDVSARVSAALAALGPLSSPAVLGVLGDVGRAVTAATEAPAHPVGAWGAFRALGEPDVQRALGFLLQIARALGGALREHDTIASKALPGETP